MDCKAKPEDWELQTKWASDCQDARCLLELRARVELLEATQHAHIEGNYKPTPNPNQIRSLLVERVMTAIERADGDDEARAAICEVAAWMRSNPDHHFPPALVFALEHEAEI
jgi:hypothetical protein